MEEQAISSSMGAMGSLLGKLHAQIVSPEIQLPKSLKEGIKHLTQDLEEINRFLVDLSTVEGPNSMVKRWMNEVRELSYDMEDYIDSTMSSNDMVYNPGMNKEILSVVTKFRSLARQCLERHERYELQRWASNPSYMVDAQDQLPWSFNAKATGLVGISESRGELIKWLSNADEAQGRLKVISILGPAGVGKSTLAQVVYREIGGQFERRAFVRASRVPDTRRLLRSMISQVRRQQRLPCSLAVQELVDNLRTHLQQKRYFIIIDGLWETISWDIIISAFPKGTQGSRILITTDIEEVAMECCDYLTNASVKWAPELDSGSHFLAQVGILQMDPLNTDDSMELFFNKVGCRTELSEDQKKYAEEIIRKCSGLPQAIIIIVSVLASQPKNSELWSHIKDFVSSRNNLSSKELLREIIGLSYYTLSQQVKTCLLYLSFYPEGYTFMKVDLLKQWTAEGFITAVADKDINEVAECYFDELVGRGLVQPNLNCSDEVMFYTVHSTVFEVIKHKSIEENFTTVIDYSGTIPKLFAKVRRLSLSFSNAKYAAKPDGFTLSLVRSLTFYGLAECLPSIMEFKLLRVLILEFWGDREQFDLSGIFVLCQLRYVRITTDSVIKLPVRMQGLKHLETLEIYASLLTVPSDIVHLPKLLHLHLQGDIKLPDYVGQLKSLRTLQSFNLSSNSEDNVKSLGEMVNLHDLHITCSATSADRLNRNLIALASSIGKHKSLKSLTLAPGVSCPSIFTDCSRIVSSPPVFLEKFEMLPPICIFSRLPEWFEQLQNLCALKIAVRELRRVDLNRIAGLQKLTVLSLYIRKPIEESIIFNSASFPFLKYLKLRCSNLRLAFQAEAIPNLRRLKLEFNVHSLEQYNDILASIEHLLNLQEINLRIGVAPGAQEIDKMEAESVFKDIISKHLRHLRFDIQRADFIEEDQTPPAPGLATTSSHSDGLDVPTAVDVTNQSSEIEVVPVPQVSPLNDDNLTSDRDIQTDRHKGVPKFGSWIDGRASPYTMYFENARKGKSPRKPDGQNDHSGDPEALSKSSPSAKASPLRTGSDPVARKPKDERCANREYDLGRNEALARKLYAESANHKHVSTNNDIAARRTGMERSPLHPFRQASSVRSEMRSSYHGYETPERRSALPKFGDWDHGPSSYDEGFTDIFKKVREERQSGVASFTTSDTGYYRSNEGCKCKHESSGFSCFGCCGHKQTKKSLCWALFRREKKKTLSLSLRRTEDRVEREVV